MGKSWLITSGKGGVGKSAFTSSAAIALSRAGLSVCIVDADIGMRNQDILLGLEGRVVYDLIDVCAKDCVLEQALLSSDSYPGVTLLPASQFGRCRDLNTKRFSAVVNELRAMFDHVLIDCPAGVEKGLRNALRCEVDETIIICTPDDVCIRDAQRTAAILDEKGKPRPRLIVNRIVPTLVRSGEMYSAKTVAETVDLELFGEMRDDVCVYRALIQHKNVMDVDCEVHRDMDRIVRRMLGETVELPQHGTEKARLLERLMYRKPLKVTAPTPVPAPRKTETAEPTLPAQPDTEAAEREE